MREIGLLAIFHAAAVHRLGASVAPPFDVQCIQPASSSHVLTLTDGRSVTLLEPLGRGSSGVVFRGLVESGWGVRRPVAVKVISLAPDVDHGDAMRQLGRIARRAACIRHPSVVHLLEIDRSDGGRGQPCQPFVVMELVEGESLASLVQGWQSDGLRVPVDFAIVVTLRAAEALGAALFTDGADGSLTGLVHGDLSPRQILVSSQGEVKVGDFGESTFQNVSSHVRSRSRLAYTAPEVACGSSANARSDVFSLGVILHELLIGPRFAVGTNVGDAMRMVRDGRIHATALAPNLPRSLRDVIEQATDPNPMGRYAHARAMAFDLRREMFRLGMTDAQTCVRHAIVGWCEVPVREGEPAQRRTDAFRRRSDIVPRLEPVSPVIRFKKDHAPRFDADAEDTAPALPFALRKRR